MSGISVNLFSIREILNMYPCIFLDTSVFSQININIDTNKKENYFQSFKIKEKLLDFWIATLKENSGIYFTENIFNELKRNPPYPKQEYNEIKKIKNRLGYKKNYFLNGFPLERVIYRENLEEKALYDELYKKYHYFTESLKEIGEKDFDLLLIGGIFSKSREDTCLISNDFGILRCYKSFLKEERIAKGDFGFYIQQGLNLFKRG